MGDISVTFEALSTGAAEIRTNYSRLTTTIEQLETDLAPMISSWSGAAQESYLACKHQWDAAAQALSQLLNSIGQAVDDAHHNYTAAEAAARSHWS